MSKNYLLQSSLWVYDLPGNEITNEDVNKANDMNMIMKRTPDEAYLIGSYNAIIEYLYDYIGIEPVDGYMYPLKDVL